MTFNFGLTSHVKHPISVFLIKCVINMEAKAQVLIQDGKEIYPISIANLIYILQESGAVKEDVATAIGRIESNIKSLKDIKPVNDLVTGGTNVPLSAEQGKVLNQEKISDAPSDGEQYVRKNGEWAQVDIKTSADGISYDNAESDLDAENVQEAIDELNQNDIELEDYGSQEIPGLEETVIARLNNQDVEIANAKLDIQQKYSEFVDAAGGVKSITDARLIKRLTSMDAIPVFDENVSYKQNDIVNYNGQPYYFEKDHKGSWTGFDAVATDLFALIMQARGQIFTGEVVNIRLFCDEASISLANVKVVCNFEDGSAQKVTYTDENGEATFFVPFGKRYGLVASDIGDFHSEKKVFYANTFSRNVNIEYQYFKYGVYAYFEDGTKMYYTTWYANNSPTVNGNFAKLIGAAYFDETEHWMVTGQGSCDNSISAGPFYDTMNLSIAKMTCDEAYNQSIRYKNGNEDEPLVIITNNTVEIDGKTITAFCPSQTQYNIMFNNINSFINILQVILSRVTLLNMNQCYLPFASRSTKKTYTSRAGSQFSDSVTTGYYYKMFLVD